MKSPNKLMDHVKGVSESPLRMILFIVFIILMVCTISIYITVYNNEQNKVMMEKFRENESSREWDIVERVINKTDVGSRTMTNVTALKLERKLLEDYPDLSVLQDEFNDAQFTKKFHSILEGSLSETPGVYGSPYMTIVGTRSFILGEFSNRKGHILDFKNKDTIVPWKTMYDKTLRPELTEVAINRVLRNAEDLAFIQTRPLPDGSTIEAVNMKNLREIYLEHGINGLKSISLLAPAYITETGDIFGVKDKYYMQSNTNHKLIIIHVINLGNVVQEHEKIIHDARSQFEYMEQYMISDNTTRVIISMLWSFVLMVISIMLIMVYNTEDRRRKSLRKSNNIEKR